MVELLGSRWFTAHTLVGIVRVQTEYDGIRYYIGAVPHASTELADAEYIADWGSTFPNDVGDVLFQVPPKINRPKCQKCGEECTPIEGIGYRCSCDFKT